MNTLTPSIHIGRGILQSKELIEPKNRRIVLIAERSVQSSAESLKMETIYLTGGESIKTREAKHRLEDELLIRKCGRDTLLIAMGGGALLDMVAFTASTYMRGISLILIPTTLLAMVDAAIGGKTAVDTPFGKNLIGSFYPPERILIDPEFLDTLPKKELLNGLAEMLKYGLIRERQIWDRLLQGASFEEMIPACIECKLSIIKEDPFETGLRRILNFGHTIGHALEQQSNYTIPHGQAVAIGCILESHLSMTLGYLPTDVHKEIADAYLSFGFPLLSPTRLDLFWEAIALDKKGRGDEPRIVLIDQIGHALPFSGAYCRSVPKKMIENTLHWMTCGPFSYLAE